MVNKDQKETNDKQEVEASNSEIFRLERLFISSDSIFKSSKIQGIKESDAIIVLDTNTLLLPYAIKNTSLPELERIYKDLAKSERLYLPARAAREFIIHRDRKLADILKALQDMKSKLQVESPSASPLLNGLEGSEDLKKFIKSLSDAKDGYSKSIDKMHSMISSWRGDDPISKIYDEIFSGRIVDVEEEEGALVSEWKIRSALKIPPGYKDASKEDLGIGDYLIWKSILALGKSMKRDLIFVTADQKADWYVRSNGSGTFPRPELVHEYRHHSDGKNFDLSPLHDLLRELQASKETLAVVEDAETISQAGLGNILLRIESNGRFRRRRRPLQTFTTPYGGGNISISSQYGSFDIQVSDATIDELWIYPEDSTGEVGVVVDGPSGSVINPSDMKPSLKAFHIAKDQHFYSVNEDGSVLIAKLIASNSPKSGDNMMISLAYYVAPDSAGRIARI